MIKLCKVLAILLVCTALAFGQASIPAKPTITAPLPALDTSTLPQNFGAAGALYNPSGAVKETGWATYAHLVDQKSGTYLFTTEDVVPVKGTGGIAGYTLETSVRAGFGTLLKQFGQLRVWGIVDGGGATTGTVTGAAAGGRSCATLPFRKTAFSFIGCYGIMKSSVISGTPKVIEFGFGKSW